MSQITVASIPRLTRTQLSSLLLAGQAANTNALAIIDVRDDDYIGGHIRGSQHVPSSQLNHRLPELVRTLQDKDTVVFHCMLSQQRGPWAALHYARERVRQLGDEHGQLRSENDGPGQRVCILTGGFEKWQEVFGDDERLTEGYARDLWKGEDE